MGSVTDKLNAMQVSSHEFDDYGMKAYEHDAGDGTYDKITVSNRITLMCPQCYKLYRCTAGGYIFAQTDNDKWCDMLIHPVFHIQCPECGYEGDAVILDNGIAECVALFNKLGNETEMCCDGHAGDGGKRGKYRSFIKFLHTPNLPNLPVPWEVKDLFLEAYTNTEIERNMAIKSLHKYVWDLLSYF